MFSHIIVEVGKLLFIKVTFKKRKNQIKLSNENSKKLKQH